MITYIKQNGVEYPFSFGMREIHSLTSGFGIEFHEAEQSISMDFDLMLQVFHLASKKGCRRHAKENGHPATQYNHLVLSTEALEDMIDEDPTFFRELEKAFDESSVVKTVMNEAEDAKKKMKSLQRN